MSTTCIDCNLWLVIKDANEISAHLSYVRKYGLGWISDELLGARCVSASAVGSVVSVERGDLR